MLFPGFTVGKKGKTNLLVGGRRSPPVKKGSGVTTDTAAPALCGGGGDSKAKARFFYILPKNMKKSDPTTSNGEIDYWAYRGQNNDGGKI